jgi:hypothetical protein
MEINILKYLPLLIPVILIQVGLLVAAYVDLARRKQTLGPKWIWVLVILVSYIGPIIYFVAGRKEE